MSGGSRCGYVPHGCRGGTSVRQLWTGRLARSVPVKLRNFDDCRGIRSTRSLWQSVFATTREGQVET